ncbi:MAG: hypothetical protein MJ097_04655 [Dorea sp.]|nr:hypothetical protein [Dorea sp.]
MSSGLSGSVFSGHGDDKHRIVKYLPAILILLLGLALTGYDYYSSRNSFTGMLERNEAGMGKKTESFEVEVEDEEKIPISLELSEIRYAEADIRKMFQRVEDRIDKEILGKNQSLDHVEYDLNLMTSLAGEPVTISWELDDYSVMMSSGELISAAMEEQEEGLLQNLYATITYTEDENRQARYQLTAHLFKPTLSKEELFVEKIRSYLMEEAETNRESRQVQLPKNWEGRDLLYYKNMDRRGLVLLLLAPVIAFLLKALEKQNEHDEIEKRKKQLARDYPEVLMKLTIFIGAGMTAKRAWRQIVKDYEKQKVLYGERHVYEEMLLAWNEMESGITEANSYLNFGRRCGTQEYVRFSALLSQNLRKGTKGLTEILRTESIQAFEERKTAARRTGEEAGTRLLLPMFLMLAIVLVIVMVPALMTIQI